MRKEVVTAAIAICLALCLQPGFAQSNSYLGLWGRIFDSGSIANASISGDASNTEHAESRFLQRLSGHAAGESRLERLAESIEEIQSMLASSSDGATAQPLTEEQVNKLTDTQMDSKVALALAHSLLLRKAIDKGGGVFANAKTSDGSSDALEPEQQPTFPFTQLGVPLPETAADKFEPAVCVKLQNFGGAEGYRAAYMGAPPCGKTSGNAALDYISWGKEARFTIDCSISEADNEEVPLGDAPDASAETLRQRLHNAAGHALSELSAAFEKPMQCRLTLATQTGEGSMLESQFTHNSLTLRKMNAINLRVCNSCKLPEILEQARRRDYDVILYMCLSACSCRISANADANAVTEPKVPPSIGLHSLRLDGRRLLGDSVVATQSPGRDRCHSTLLRVPRRAVSEGFTLTGAVSLDAGDGRWGVGDMSSVGIEIGTQRFLGQGLLQSGESQTEGS